MPPRISAAPFARVVFGLPVEGPFDYIVPERWQAKIQPGERVKVSFRTGTRIGYVVGSAKSSSIRGLKPILNLIDETPILDEKLLLLCRQAADYYCASWGEMIETALPDALRKGRPLEPAGVRTGNLAPPPLGFSERYFFDLSGESRWEEYLKLIGQSLDAGHPAILAVADNNAVRRAGEFIRSRIQAPVAFLCRNQPGELQEWARIKRGEARIVIGTRSCIFAPVNGPGVIIVDQENDSAYKQDQVPHYHCRELAVMRAKLEGAVLVLGADALSLEAYQMAAGCASGVQVLPRLRDFPEVKVIDMQAFRSFKKGRYAFLSKYLEDSILAALSAGEKILLFLNRRGFATFASCSSCGAVLKCDRCNVNLIYHYKGNTLGCPHCNYIIPAPRICPTCNSSYVRYTGLGTEKVESEIARIFPQARIRLLETGEKPDFSRADIFIATESVIRGPGATFDLVAALAMDISLDRPDYRAGEKTFILSCGLLKLSGKKLVIQTNHPNHHSLDWLSGRDPERFYSEELKERQQLRFPPFSHLGLVKLRHLRENSAKYAAEALFARFSEKTQSGVKALSCAPGQPVKLRGYFYWQILLKGSSAEKICRRIKSCLKGFRHSGIIITSDIDPV